MKEAYKAGDRLSISGIAKNYSGANIENGKVTYMIQERPFRWGFQDKTIAAGKTLTNEKGEFSISFDTKEISGALFRGANSYIVSVTVTASNGETQEAQYPIYITDQRYQLNAIVIPEINKNNPSNIQVTAQNTNGYPLTENITYELYSLQPLQKIGEQYNQENPPVDKKVLEGNFTTGDNKKLELNLSSLASGAYLLKLSGTGQ